MIVRALKVFFILFIMLWGSAVLAKGENLGLGFIVGDPTGLSLKVWQDRTHAVDVGLGWNTQHDESFHLHADYLIHDFSIFKLKPGAGRMPFYYGIGGVIAKEDYYDYYNRAFYYHNDTRVGVRIPVGISYLFAGNPLEFFAELAPRLDLTPSSDFTVDAALGMRFYFK